MKRRIFVLTLCVVLLCGAMILPTGATVPSCPEKVVYDRAGLLTVAEVNALNNAVHEAWHSAEGCAFFVTTHKMNSQYDDIYKGVDFLRDYDRNGGSVVVLVITLDRGTYYYDMYYYGRASRRINQREVDYILDHKDVYSNIKGGHLVEGASSFVNLSAQAYNERIAGASYGVIIAISAVISLVIAVVACIGVKSAYSMKKRSVDYPLDRFAKLELTDHQDTFMGSFVTRRVIQSNSGGGGSSHGGGRGHAGGR